MKNGKIRRTLGIIMVVIQLISIISLFYHSVTIWDDETDAWRFSHPPRTGLNFSEWIYGFESGSEQFKESFEYFFRDYESVKYGSGDYLTIYIRESLGAGEHDAGIGLFIFDVTVLLSYLFIGILGICLYYSGTRAKDSREEVSTYISTSLDKRFRGYKTGCAILSILFALLSTVRIYTLVGAWLTTTSIGLLIGFVFLAVYFIGYFGKKKSVLISSAIMIVGLDLGVTALRSVASLFTYDGDLNFIAFPRIIFAELQLVTGIMLLIAGRKMYNNDTSKKVTTYLLVGVIIAACESLAWPILLAVVYDSSFIYSICLPYLVFTIMVYIYVRKSSKALHKKKVIPITDSTSVPVPSPAPAPAPADMLTPVPSIEKVVAPVSTATKESDSTNNQDDFALNSNHTLYCRKCGVKIPTDSQFCNRCGTKVVY